MKREVGEKLKRSGTEEEAYSIWNVLKGELLDTHSQKHRRQQEPHREDQSFAVQFDLQRDNV